MMGIRETANPDRLRRFIRVEKMERHSLDKDPTLGEQVAVLSHLRKTQFKLLFPIDSLKHRKRMNFNIWEKSHKIFYSHLFNPVFPHAGGCLTN